MDSIYNWGIDIIIVIQKMRSDAMDHFFRAVTAMGNDMFYMLILPLFYWCIDKRQSLRLFYLFMFSGWLNAVTKDLLNQPRPYILNESIKVDTTGGPGIPSGHAQGSFVFWGYLALWVHKRWFSVFCIAIIMLIAFSRLYLGVHFPTDILGGWLLGICILFFGNTVADKIESRISSFHPLWILLLGTILPIALSLILPTKYSVSPMGITAGLTGAILLENKFVNFIIPTGFKESAIRYIIGMTGLLAIYIGLKHAIPKESRMYLQLVFFQYYLMGIWVGFVAPWIFSKLHNTKSRESSPV